MAHRIDNKRTKSRARRGLVDWVLIVLIVSAMVAMVVYGYFNYYKKWYDVPAVDAPQAQLLEKPAAKPAQPIGESQPMAMHIPKLGITAGFDDAVCPLTDGALNPPTLKTVCYFTAPDRPYTLPSTDSKDVTVVAGHAGAGIPSVLDGLYDNGYTMDLGDELLIRTADSGDSWLVYKVTDRHSPDKPELGDDKEIWGEDATPGRLLLISCIMPGNPFAQSTQNVVLGFEFSGVKQQAA
ncbi:sortase [Corynebacterium ulceribovis]|uniref:sortase n=1 Tax=Corynebacterium ulceribovis TaxID=487732 RepID=UPI001FE097B1|nr:sortase [Corynebacterium ulceribovis]